MNNIMENFSDFLEDEYYVITETEKPFDEYLKKHNYDPKTNTIETPKWKFYENNNGEKRENVELSNIEGLSPAQKLSNYNKKNNTEYTLDNFIVEPETIRMNVGKIKSNKERNRINKFLRENDYDPKTETIQTAVPDRSTKTNQRIKFNIINSNDEPNQGAYYHYESNDDKDHEFIHMNVPELSSKPRHANQVKNHEEGHFNERSNKIQRENISNSIDFFKAALDHYDELDTWMVDEETTGRQALNDLGIKTKKDIYEKLAELRNDHFLLRRDRHNIDKIEQAAESFNKNKIDNSEHPQRVGDYHKDHDILPTENYADVYGMEHNPYSSKNNVMPVAHDPHRNHGTNKQIHQRIINQRDGIVPENPSKRQQRKIDRGEYNYDPRYEDPSLKNKIMERLELYKDPVKAYNDMGLNMGVTDDELTEGLRTKETTDNAIKNKKSIAADIERMDPSSDSYKRGQEALNKMDEKLNNSFEKYNGFLDKFGSNLSSDQIIDEHIKAKRQPEIQGYNMRREFAKSYMDDKEKNPQNYGYKPVPPETLRAKRIHDGLPVTEPTPIDTAANNVNN